MEEEFDSGASCRNSNCRLDNPGNETYKYWVYMDYWFVFVILAVTQFLMERGKPVSVNYITGSYYTGLASVLNQSNTFTSSYH